MNFMKKILEIIKKIVDVVLTIFVILFVLMICLQRFSNNEISIFKYRIFTVVSGSMEPDYNIGEVLISKEIDPKDIKVGDDVSYLGNSGTFKDKVVTHRVIEIETDVDGRLVFHTKGLANLVEDPIVYENQIYGIVVREAKILSFVYKFVGTPSGMFIFIVIPILYIVGSEMIYVMLEKEDKRRAKLKEKREEQSKEERKEEKKETETVSTKKKKVVKK